MGPIYDRRKEHLGTSDMAVVRMRRLMLQSVRDFVANGKTPLGLERALNYQKLRAEEALVPLDTPWQTLCRLGEPQPA
jgi:hypothetical protein